MSLARQNIHFLDQATALLGALDERLYTTCDDHGHACVGAHFRHVLDCYRCFLSGLDKARIDYDARERNPALESDLQVARRAVAEIRAALEALAAEDRNRSIQVRVDAAAWCDADPWTQSSLGRELQFLLSHTVHHYALIAMTLRTFGFEPGAGFGVAPSTLEYRETETSSNSTPVMSS